MRKKMECLAKKVIALYPGRLYFTDVFPGGNIIMIEREVVIGIMKVYQKLSAENKVYSCDDIDIDLLCEDLAKIAIKCIYSMKEYGWSERVTDFIERELLDLYGIK